MSANYSDNIYIYTYVYVVWKDFTYIYKGVYGVSDERIKDLYTQLCNYFVADVTANIPSKFSCPCPITAVTPSITI